MAKTDDLEIIIEDDPVTKPAAPDAAAPPAAVAKDSADAPNDDIDPAEALKKLKGDLERSKQEAATERTGRLDAERRAQASGNEAATRAKEVYDSNLALVTNAIENLEGAQGTAKASYAAALAAGDHEQAADFNMQMAENAANLLQLRNGKATMEEEAKNPRRPEPTREPDRSDPVEFIAKQLTTQSAAWVRAHPEYARDDNLWSRVIAADGLAKSYGIKTDTPEYFAHVEKTLGIGHNDDGGRRIDRHVDSDTPPPAAAPGNGSKAPGDEGPRNGAVRLTREEVEIAEMNGLTPQEYAKNKLLLKKEGRMQ